MKAEMPLAELYLDFKEKDDYRIDLINALKLAAWINKA